MKSLIGVLILTSVLISVESRAQDVLAQRGNLASSLSGHLVADGNFRDFKNGTQRDVHIDIHGVANGGGLTLDMATHFSDGQKEHKTWTFKRDSQGRYLGYRPDLIGAASIEDRGNRITMRYKAHVPTKEGQIYDLNFEENYEFKGTGVIENVVTVSWMLIPVGQARMTIRKSGP